MPQTRMSFQNSFLPEPRHKENHCVLSSLVQWKSNPVGWRETWAVIQGLILTGGLRRVLSPSWASVSQSEK